MDMKIYVLVQVKINLPKTVKAGEIYEKSTDIEDDGIYNEISIFVDREDALKELSKHKTVGKLTNTESGEILSCCIYYLQERVYDENGEYGIVGLTWVAEEEIE